MALGNDDPRRAGLIGLANEAAIGADGWVRLSSYGDFPKVREVLGGDGQVNEERFLQRVTLENARELARQHNSLFGKLRRLRRGAPIFRGHADRWQVAEAEGIKLPDAPLPVHDARGRQVGVFASLEARGDGVYGLPVFTDDARVAIENDGLKYFSPFWWTHVTGQLARDGQTWFIAEPFEFISAALTDSPNLKDSPALANERGSQPTKPPDTMNKELVNKLRALLLKHGIALANSDDATIEAALPELENRLAARTALENEKTTLTGRVTALEGERDTARTALANEQTEHGKSKTALANERAKHNELLCALAVAEGRIAPSELAARLATLEKDGEPARAALANETPKHHVTAHTTASRKDTASTKATAPRPGQRLAALANELLKKCGYDSFEQAHAAAKTTEEGRKLVAQIEAEAKAKE